MRALGQCSFCPGRTRRTPALRVLEWRSGGQFSWRLVFAALLADGPDRIADLEGGAERALLELVADGQAIRMPLG